MGGIFFPSGAPTGTACLQRPFTSNPIKSCTVFISEICYFRMTEIFSQLHRRAESCKYIFGSVTVTMFSWCFFFFLFCKFEIVYYHFGREKKETVCVCLNLSQYSKENKLAIKFTFFIYIILLGKELGNLRCLGKVLKYRCRAIFWASIQDPAIILVSIFQPDLLSWALSW